MTSSTASYVPTINIQPYIQDPHSSDAVKVVHDVRKACENIGFFQLVGHNIPRGLQQAAFEGSAALFGLPLEEKTKLSRDKSGAAAGGYEFMGSQGLEDGKLPDLSEVSADDYPGFRRFRVDFPELLYCPRDAGQHRRWVSQSMALEIRAI